MSPKWAKKAYFGDISYNVFNERKSSNYMLETLYFTISSPGKQPTEIDNCCIYSQYLQNLVCQILVLQSIASS